MSACLLLLMTAAFAAEPTSDGSASTHSPVGASATVIVTFVDGEGSEWARLGGLDVTLRRAAETRVLRADGNTFLTEGLPAGVWRLGVQSRHFLPIDTPVEVPANGVLRLRRVLVSNPDEVEILEVRAYEEGAVLERSAQAVTVVDTEEAQRQSADLGEVMARSQGVGVQRSGGLGSNTRFSLNGMTDEQVRFFLDGVPLELAGAPAGIANVPVDKISRVEVYRGVVPVRFGADALGGAVNLVSEAPTTPVGGSASWQFGSFHTHRVAASAHASHAASGVYGRLGGYLDLTRNDYEVDVEVADDRGRLSPASVTRFHDGYRSGGGTLTLGIRDRSWADTLEVRGFGSALEQEVQSNVVMSVPYGEPVYRVQTGGGTGRWKKDFGFLSVDVLGGYTRTESEFQDLGECVYDWYGECVRERSQPGELGAPGTDQVAWDQSAVGRMVVEWRPNEHHGITLSVAPTAFTRTGEDRLDDGEGRDPLTAQRDSTTVVSGLEHQLDALDERFQNLLFVKNYAQAIQSEEPLVGGAFRQADRSTLRFGFGESARFHIAPWVYAKLSYEWATRLATPEEIFGDAVLIRDNLDLVPETSHNVNLGITMEGDTRVGELAFDSSGFLRETDDLIILLGNDRNFSYFNVYGARSVGAEASAGWTAPGDWVALDVNGSFIELRNTASEGTFGEFAGDRIPNRPWLYANASASVGASGFPRAGDRISLDWYSRYVKEFYRGWPSVGLIEFKQTVPDQLSHTAALTYTTSLRSVNLSASVEVQNLTNADLYDFFGVQRPGRSVFGKVTMSR